MSSTNWKRSFFTIWTGQAVSLLGSSLAGFALIWWLASTSTSATVLARATMMMVLPQIVLGPLMGALVDRWDRRVVMIVADGVIALLSLGLAGLFWSGRARFWHVYLVLLTRAVGQVIHLLAMQSSTPLLVPEKHLSRVAGMNQTLQGGMNIIAPPLGALLLGVLPIESLLLVDVATALFAVLPLCLIDIPRPSPVTGAPEKKPSVWVELQEGLRYVWSWPGLTIILAMAALLNFFGIPCLSFVPLLVTNHFRMGALELGWLQTVSGVGLLGGGLLLSTWGGFRSRVVTMFAALALEGCGMVLLGVAPASAFYVALIGNLLWGVARPIIDGLVFALIQAIVPPDTLGRVFSLMLSACALMTPLGLLVAGPAVDALGVQFWFALTGVLTLSASALGLLIPAVRQLEQRKVALLGLIVMLALVACAPASRPAQRTPSALPTFTPTVTKSPTPTVAMAPTATATPVARATHPVMTWLREGGIAGFCDAVTVYGDGRVEVTWCRGNELREEKTLSPEQSVQVQAWVETYAAFEYEQRDEAVADAMRVRLTFAGRGAEEIADAVRQTMLDWAAALVPRATGFPALDPGTVVETYVRTVLALKDVTIHSGPGTTYESIGPVFEGQVAWVTGQSTDGAWWRVICPDDTVGDCWVSADPELTEPTTPPGAWPVYMLASGASVEYPVGWSPSPGGYDGTSESVWFVSPEADVAPVGVEVYYRPLGDRDIADPYTWQPNEGGYEVQWARPISTVGGLSGLEFVWGAYSKAQEQWDTPPSLMAILYSPKHELEVRLTTLFDRPALDMLETAGLTETVQARFGVPRRMAQSIRLHPATGWEAWRDTEADGLFELKHPPDWTVQGGAFACGISYDLDSLKLVVFEGCWADGVGGSQLTFFDTLQRFRGAFSEQTAASSRTVNGMQVEVVHYRAAGDNGIVPLDPGPGTVAVWQVGEQGYALIDPGNRHQGDGAFDGVLGSFLLLPPMPRAEPRPLPGRSVDGGSAFDLSGVGATIVLPAGYGVVTNNEYNRRGSLVSFDFTPYGGDLPRFAEIQFFSEVSIRTFHERCASSGGFCFEGDYPDVERYHAQRAATAQCTDLASYEAMQFGGRCYLVTDHRCTGDACVLREYTTFLDETMVSVLIVMQDPSQVGASDELFASFDLAKTSPERHLLIDQTTQRMYVYEGGNLVRELPVSTGRPTSVTLTRAWTGTVGADLGSGGVDGGLYADFKWFLFQDLYGSVLIHSVPYTRQGDQKVYDQLDALGIRPASRGCVRISPEDAQWLKAWGPVGVPIEITAWPGRVEQVSGA